QHLGPQLAQLPLPPGLLRQYRHVKDLVENPKTDPATIRATLFLLETGIHAELGAQVFLRLSPDRVAMYEQNVPPFGMEVADYFTDIEITRDIAACSRCLALEEWTASVFHCMRVLGVGVRLFAKRIGVSEPGLE